MKIPAACMALLALCALVGGCEKRESTRAAQPPAAAGDKTADSSRGEARCPSGVSGFHESVRRRHLELL